jgi:hypothetical protein
VGDKFDKNREEIIAVLKTKVDDLEKALAAAKRDEQKIKELGGRDHPRRWVSVPASRAKRCGFFPRLVPLTC